MRPAARVSEHDGIVLVGIPCCRGMVLRLPIECEHFRVTREVPDAGGVLWPVLESRDQQRNSLDAEHMAIVSCKRRSRVGRWISAVQAVSCVAEPGRRGIGLDESRSEVAIRRVGASRRHPEETRYRKEPSHAA